FSLGGNGRGNFIGNLYQIADDVSMTRGTHQFGFGGHLGEARTTTAAETGRPPNFNFTGAQTGAGLADFLTGRGSDFTQSLGFFQWSRMKYLSLYVQDTWQFKPRLTFSYGLRWAPVLPLVDYRRPVPNVLNFSMDRYRQGLRSSVFVNAPPGMLYPGD